MRGSLWTSRRGAWLGASLALLVAGCGGSGSSADTTNGGGTGTTTDTGTGTGTGTDTGTGTAGGGQGGGQTTGQGGQGQGGQAHGGQGQGGQAQECTKDADCDDKNDCTTDACGGGSCKHDATPIDDGDVCTTDACDPVKGVTHEAVTVDDGDACTSDACDPKSGVSHTPVPIDDEDACTTDACDPKAGVSHTAVATDDGDACTDDTCDPKAGVSHTAVAIDDANACTTDACDAIQGISHTAVAIDDANACTTDACDPLQGVSHTPVAIDDANVCTTDACSPQQGVTHTPVAVDDANVCTTDACDPVQGVSHTPIAVDDGNACTSDKCDPVGGVTHTAIVCNDNSACTTDACNNQTGCVFTAINVNDGNACTTDKCDPVGGVTHTAVVCSDNNLCTTDTCNTQTGCVFTAKAVASDNNGCTTDACDPATGNPKYTAIANCCSHSECANTGLPLDAAACSWGAGNDCATKVCAADPYCCGTNWDDICVGEAKNAAICPASAVAPLPNAAYAADVVFKDQLGTTTMTIAWDGTSYWSSSGGGAGGVRYAKYSGAGAALGTYSPGIDFRSVFTKGGNGATVYAREYASNLIKQQGAAGVFSNVITLAGGALDAQAAVVWNEDASELVAFNAGTVSRWSAAGASIGTVALTGFGNLNGENTQPQNRGIVKVGGYYFTYSAGVLSAWSAAGARVKTTVLTSAGTSSDSYYSLSYANGRIFVVDAAGGSWRGYPVGFGGAGGAFTCGCAHTYCTAGAALTNNCDPCVKKICEVDSYCCTTSWDGTCVNEANTVCHVPVGADCK